MVPLAIAGRRAAREIVRGGKLADRLAHDRLGRGGGNAAGCVGRAPDGPAVAPEDRADIGHPPDRARIDHDEACVAAIGQVDDRALVAAGLVVDLVARFPGPNRLLARDTVMPSRRGMALNIVIFAALDDLQASAPVEIDDALVGDAAHVTVQAKERGRAVRPHRGHDIGAAVGVEEQPGSKASSPIRFIAQGPRMSRER
jgi:hypothetical protein